MGKVARYFGFEPPPAHNRVAASVLSVDPATQASLLSLAGITSEAATVTRQQAMGVPALSNGVTLLLAIAQQLPLTADPATSTAATRSFLETLDPTVPAGWTIARTVDDLIWYQRAIWRITGRDSNNFPSAIEWIANSRCLIDTARKTVTIDGEEQDPADLIPFHGVAEGLLSTAERSRAISTAIANVKAAKTYANNPRPAWTLTDKDGQEPLDDDDAKKYLRNLIDIASTDGAAYIGGLTLAESGWSAKEIQLVEARQQDAVEMARLLAIHPRYVAAPSQGSDLTYANLADVRHDLYEVGGLSTYLVPIEQRLSMPDVTPRRTVVKFGADSFFNRVTEQPSQPGVPA